MRRWIKILLGIVAGVLLVFVIGIVVIANYDWNRSKTWVIAVAGKALGRPIAIDGPLTVKWERDTNAHNWHSWFPGPHVSAQKVTVSNFPGGKAANFATAESVDFDLSILPLLTHTVAVPDVRIHASTANFERSADGHANWLFAATPDGQPGSAWHLDLGRLTLDTSDVTVRDQVNALDVKIHVDVLQKNLSFDELLARQTQASQQDASKRVGEHGAQQMVQEAAKRNAQLRGSRDNEQHYAFGVSVDGTLKGAAVRGTGNIGGVFALKNSDHPFPLQADVHIGDTHIAFVGTLTDPTDLDALDLRVWMSGDNLAQIYDILRITLPESPPYATEGHLIGRFTPDNKNVRFENFTARVGASDLRGELVYESKAPRPLLSGKIESDLLQFRDLAPLIGAGRRGAASLDASDKSTQPADRVLPAEPFRPKRWQGMDADVLFTGDRVFRDAQLPIHKVDTRIRMDNALLTLDPLRFTFARGDVLAAMRFDGRSAPIKSTFKLTARGMQLTQLVPIDRSENTKFGLANASANLSASGNSVGSLLGAANGELSFAIDGGTVSQELLETAGLNLPNILATKLLGDKPIQINCAGADLIAKNGVFDARTFLIDTQIATIDVSGTVNFGTEQLDLTVHPDSKGLRLLSLRAPLHVDGSFKQPNIGVDKKVVLTRGAIAVGLGLLAAPAALLAVTATKSDDKTDSRCAAVTKHALASLSLDVAKPDAAKTDPKPEAAK